MPGPRILILSFAIATLALCGPAAAAEWQVIAAKSRLGFEGTAAGVSFKGSFKRWQAQISFDPSDAAGGRAVVTVDMTSAETGDPQKDEALPRSEWFDIKAFPTATFEVRSFRAKDATSYEAVATLRIRDVRKDVVVPMTIEVAGDTLHASGHLDLVRTDYGVGQGSWRSGQWVGLQVTATFDVTAARMR
jgi:polyisoprenoid-binding protein YceI